MANEIRCIICGERKQGLPIKEDPVINLIRLFKRNVTRNEKGYSLVVCKECFVQYNKSRKAFERRQTYYMIIGLIFAAVIIFSAADKLIAIVYGIVVFFFMYAMSLMSYIPAIELPAGKQASKKPSK